MNKIKTRSMMSMFILFMLASVPMAQAVVYPDDPVAGCVGFPDWWTSQEATLGAINMIYFVIKALAFAGYSDEMILNIAAGFCSELPLP